MKAIGFITAGAGLLGYTFTDTMTGWVVATISTIIGCTLLLITAWKEDTKEESNHMVGRNSHDYPAGLENLRRRA